MPETILQGGHGVVSGGANIFTKLFVDLDNASLEQDFDQIEVLRNRMIMINELIYDIGKHSSR